MMNAPTAPGLPALPKMLLEVIIIAANPALTKTYYEGKYKDGDDREPTCSSDDGIVPDAHIPRTRPPGALTPVTQHTNCAECPQNQWGSKISEASGKEVKACSDNKRLVVLPADGLDFKATGLAVTPSSLQDWGKYVKALSGRGIKVDSVVTNLTFDSTAAHPKVMFSFNRFLTEAEYLKVQERTVGDDVKNIITPMRQAAPLALPAPAPAPQTAAPATTAPEQGVPAASVPAAVTPVAAAPTPAPAPVATGGFGAAQVSAVTSAPAADTPKRTRAKRTPAEPVTGTPAHLAHLPPAILTAVLAVGETSPAGVAMLAQFPAPAQPVAPVQPAAVAVAAEATPVVTSPATVAAPVNGFGSAAVLATPPINTPATPSAAAMSLKDILAKKLGVNQPTTAS
jgi:hypothetical protein